MAKGSDNLGLILGVGAVVAGVVLLQRQRAVEAGEDQLPSDGGPPEFPTGPPKVEIKSFEVAYEKVQ